MMRIGVGMVKKTAVNAPVFRDLLNAEGNRSKALTVLDCSYYKPRDTISHPPLKFV